MLAPVYTSIKELMINAIKANYKNIYFEGYNPKIDTEQTIDYETALRLFQLEITRENAVSLEEFARASNYRTEIEVWTIEKVLHVMVTNPVKMTETELANVKRKLMDAEKCRDLADYFLNNMDDPYREGAGLGLILIMMMLKSLRAPKDSLVITSGEDRTSAYLKIPLINDVQNCA
ncbi:MAG TPA: hypothetical protein PLA65_10705 [Spirochaetota bacterium]|nr:hypothetical protein [Spirochaetota bacterium]HPG49863.1 hypothetical protein [Spirochaetota bacterium]HPN12524.1 hypothetical protein [Spirochaetota bacterium]